MTQRHWPNQAATPDFGIRNKRRHIASRRIALGPPPRLESRMTERIRGGKLTVLNPVPPIRRVWLRASEVLSAKSQVYPSSRSGFVYHTD
jgi:hypothetical protein